MAASYSNLHKAAGDIFETDLFTMVTYNVHTAIK